MRSIALAILVAPGLRLFVRWLDGDLGGRPITEFTHGTGDWTIYFLLASLAMTPLRTALDWQFLVPLRRRIGVAAACYAGLHFLLYVIDQKLDLLVVASEIALRFYLTIGFCVFLGLLALAITSTDGWMRKLGRRWKSLHRLAYPLAAFGLFHYFLQTKANVSPAVFVAGLYLWEMLWRLQPLVWRRRWWPLPFLAIAAGLSTAAVEALWYGLATRIDPWRVLDANLKLGYGPRPAVEVTICLLLLALFAGAMRLRLFRARGGRQQGGAVGVESAL
jgi:methionine sulfoxide reductase heme-binding subunit